MRDIRNYTSTVPAARSIAAIEEQLAASGVLEVNKRYTDGRVSALVFRAPVPGGEPMVVRLPAKVAEVERVLASAVKRGRSGTRQRIADQAERTAWKILAEWVDMQLTLVRLGQATAVEVFLPYILCGEPGRERTVYDALAESKFKQLKGGS